MAKTDNTDSLTATIRELEQVNAGLAERVGELTTDLEARDATIRERAQTIDQLNAAAEDHQANIDQADRVIEGLRSELRRRSSGAPLALDITALLDLHRISGNDRYLNTARRLGDELAAQHDATD